MAQHHYDSNGRKIGTSYSTSEEILGNLIYGILVVIGIIIYAVVTYWFIIVGLLFLCLIIWLIVKAVKKRQRRIFSGDLSLSEITLHRGFKKIEEQAFRDCTNLTNIDIPDSVTEIGEGAFGDCI